MEHTGWRLNKELATLYYGPVVFVYGSTFAMLGDVATRLSSFSSTYRKWRSTLVRCMAYASG
jgi:hypothetical protein